MTNIFRMNSFTWWLSDDKNSGVANSFQSWEGVEIRNNPLSLTLQKAPTEETINWTVVGEFFYNSLLYLVTDSWYLYSFNWNTITEVRSDLGSGVVNIVLFGEFVYILYSTTTLKYLAKDDIGWTITTHSSSFSLTDNRRVWSKHNEWLFISDWHFLFRLDKDNTAVEEIISLDKNSENKWMSDGGNLLKIYSSDWLNTTVSYATFATAWEEKVVESREWRGLDIQYVVNKSGVDYLFTTDGVYVSQGFDKNRLKKIEWISWKNAAINKNITYFAVWKSVYSWWNLNNNFPEVASTDVTLTEDVEYVSTIWNYVIACTAGNIHIIDVLEWDYQAEGVVKSRVYVGDSVITDKWAKELRVGYNPLPENTSITINLYKDLEDTAVFTTTITETDSMFTKLPLSFGFNLLEAEIVLNSSNWTSSPELLDFMVLFDNNGL